MIEIHVSYLPYYNDCPRRSIVKIVPEMAETYNIKMRELPGRIAMSYGTAYHKSSEVLLKQKMSGERHRLSDALDAGVCSLQKNVSNGVEYDRVTKDCNVAEQQLIRCVKTFEKQTFTKIIPINCETRRKSILKTRLNDVTVLTGMTDAEEDGVVWDWKTGLRTPKAQSQMGGYSLLRRSHQQDTSRVVIAHNPRVVLSKPPADISEIEYHLPVCENLAKITIRRIIGDIETLKKYGSVDMIIPNPASSLCGEKYCPLYGLACKL